MYPLKSNIFRPEVKRRSGSGGWGGWPQKTLPLTNHHPKKLKLKRKVSTGGSYFVQEKGPLRTMAGWETVWTLGTGDDGGGLDESRLLMGMVGNGGKELATTLGIHNIDCKNTRKTIQFNHETKSQTF